MKEKQEKFIKDYVQVRDLPLGNWTLGFVVNGF